MFRFIKQLALFFFVFVALLFCADWALSNTFNNNANFKLKPTVSYLVLGHSHPECAFNDSIISNFKNLACSGENFFYIYQKAKQIIPQNPSVKAVFIEFTNNSINNEMNDWIYADKFILENYPKYAAFISYNERFYLFYKNSLGFIKATPLAFKNLTQHLFNKEYDIINEYGNYQSLTHIIKDSLLAIKPISHYQNNNTISTKNIEYLKKLIQLCKQNNKQVYLLRSPMHPKYQGFVNEKHFNEILKQEFSTIQFLDFSKFVLNDSCFSDLEHLNYKGAKTFSLWFDALLKKQIIQKDNPQQLIDSLMQ